METLKKILWAIFPGLAPEKSVSGIRISVNGSGTTKLEPTPGQLAKLVRSLLNK